MKHNNQQLGTPEIIYKNTKSYIEANYTTPGMFGYATDTEEIGFRDSTGGKWGNLSAAGGNHASTHEAGGSDIIKLDNLGIPDDNTDLDARHGLLPKLPNDFNKYLNGAVTARFASEVSSSAIVAKAGITNK